MAAEEKVGFQPVQLGLWDGPKCVTFQDLVRQVFVVHDRLARVDSAFEAEIFSLFLRVVSESRTP